MQLIPTPEYSNNDISVSINGVSYRLLVQWMERQEAWYLSISNTDGSPVISNIRMDYGINLLEQYNITIFEGARLFLTRSASRNEPLTFNNLGLDRFYTLAYATDQELEDFTNNIVALFA